MNEDVARICKELGVSGSGLTDGPFWATVRRHGYREWNEYTVTPLRVDGVEVGGVVCRGHGGKAEFARYIFSGEYLVADPDCAPRDEADAAAICKSWMNRCYWHRPAADACLYAVDALADLCAPPLRRHPERVGALAFAVAATQLAAELGRVVPERAEPRCGGCCRCAWGC